MRPRTALAAIFAFRSRCVADVALALPHRRTGAPLLRVAERLLHAAAVLVRGCEARRCGKEPHDV
jgi:hypothetical protein